MKSAGFGPTFFRPSLPEGETQQTKKAIRDKCPISPTKSKSIGTEGSCPRTFPRVGPRVGPGLAGFPYALLACFYLCFVVVPAGDPSVYRNPASKKGTRDKCPSSPTKSKRVRKEGSCPRPFPRIRRRGGPARGGSFPYALLLLSTTYASWWCQLAAPVYTETQQAIANEPRDTRRTSSTQSKRHNRRQSSAISSVTRRPRPGLLGVLSLIHI